VKITNNKELHTIHRCRSLITSPVVVLVHLSYQRLQDEQWLCREKSRRERL